MGGGDLNLKKSWHPQTLKNIERVWKAEQRHEAERKKIEELQKELREERAREEITRYAEDTGAIKKKEDRLDWMYQGPGGQVSRDEYLLGRPIDRQITQQYEEPESGPSAETGLLPGSIFNPSVAASTLDLAAKIREDPLFAIRKREEEKKRNILTNPVKMKMIKEMLRHNLEKEKKKDKKKRKEKKRKEKRSRKHSASDDASSSDEKKPRIHHRGTAVSDNSNHETSRYGLQLPANRHHHTDGKERRSFKGRSSRSPVSERPGRSSPSSRTTDSKTQNAYSRPAPQMLRDGAREKQRSYRHHKTSHSKHLSSEELERKRQEMMDFARQRDDERVTNVKKYHRQDEQEKERDRTRGQAGFIHNMKLESAGSSLEDRVKRNINSLQRTPAALEKNFMKR